METIQFQDLAVFLTVLGFRILVPLFIPRFPLPGVIAAFLLDAADQTIFQTRTTLPLESYQAYDKALDVYYLTIAYCSTLRNWTNPFAFQVSRFLFYLRLVGVLAFELTQLRAVLFLFPNTFEYFFIFYELTRLRWDPRRMSKKLLVTVAAGLWIFIKLPQEYWLHIAEMDMTDFIKQHIFGVSTASSWGEIVAANPLAPVLLILSIMLACAGVWLVLHKLPPADWNLAWSPDAHTRGVTRAQTIRVMQAQARRFLDWELVEKLVLVSLVSLIFARILPGASDNLLGLELGILLLIGFNTALSEWLTRRGVLWHSTVLQFAAMASINAMFVSGLFWFLPSRLDLTRLGIGLLFVLLGTLLIVLYDRYQPIHQARVGKATDTLAVKGMGKSSDI